MWDRWARLSTRTKAVVAVLVVAGAPFFIAGMISGAKDSGSDTAAKPSATKGANTPQAGPTFTYPGDPQCAITYTDRGDGSMSWTAKLTVAGELITHVTDSSGTIYRHDVHAGAGATAFTAAVPLTQITDIGGNVDSGSKSYGCSVRRAS